MRPMQRIRMGLLLANIKLGMLTRDAYSGPKDPNPENWRTISGAKVHLTNGKIDGGAGEKFHGNNWVGKEMHASDPRAQEGDLFGQYGWSVAESKTEREEEENKKKLKTELNEYNSMIINGQRENAEWQAYEVYEAARKLDHKSKEYKEAINAIGWNDDDVKEVEEARKREESRETERFEKNKAAWEKMQKENAKTALEKFEEKFSVEKEGEKESTENKSSKGTLKDRVEKYQKQVFDLVSSGAPMSKVESVVKDAGREVLKDIEKIELAEKRFIRPYENEVKKKMDAFQKAKEENAPDLQEKAKEADRAIERLIGVNKKNSDLYKDNISRVRDIIGGARGVGATNEQKKKQFGKSKSKVRSLAEEAMDALPFDWMKQSVEYGEIGLKSNNLISRRNLYT